MVPTFCQHPAWVEGVLSDIVWIKITTGSLGDSTSILVILSINMKQNSNITLQII